MCTMFGRLVPPVSSLLATPDNCTAGVMWRKRRMHETMRLKWDIWEAFFGVVGDGGGGGALWGPEGGEERVNWKMGKQRK